MTIAASPLWLQARLLAAGQRPINNVVDITNYAMLLTGQPLHAFDLDRIAGAQLTIRRASDGEQVRTLDGQERTLDGGMVVIDDADGPTSIAAIMGGERSEVHEATTNVLLEVANWDGPAIHRASWALGLRSEASGRFEKGLAPEQCMLGAGGGHGADARALRRHAGAGHARHVAAAACARADRTARAARRGDPRRRGAARAPGARSSRRSTSASRPRARGCWSPCRRHAGAT